VNGFGAGILSGFGTGLALGGVQSLVATSAALAPFATVVAPVATIGLLGYGAYELFIKDDGKAGKQLFGAIVNVASSIGNVLDGSDWTATDQDLATVGGVVGGLTSMKIAAAAAGVGSEVAAQGIARLRAPPEVSVTPEILAPEAPTEGELKNWKGSPIDLPEGHVLSPRDPALNAPPIYREGPFTATQREGFLSGNSGGTMLAPHHRHQLPLARGGVIDELPGPGHPEGNLHTGGTPSRHPNASIFNGMEGGDALRAAEIRSHWVTKGGRLIEVEPDVWIDPGG
jgi:hypothetical protein